MVDNFWMRRSWGKNINKLFPKKYVMVVESIVPWYSCLENYIVCGLILEEIIHTNASNFSRF